MDVIRKIVRRAVREAFEPADNMSIERLSGYRHLIRDIEDAERLGQDVEDAKQRFVDAVKEQGFSVIAAWTHLGNLGFDL